jgi:endoglucanase
MVLLGIAHALTGDLRHPRAMHRCMDYLMGTNAMRLSYVTGYGEAAESDLHDRLAWGHRGRGPATPYPAGWLSGGPNSTLVNDTATPKGRAPAKSYAGPGTAPGAWASKENAVNWNAPLVWAATWLNVMAPRLADRWNAPSRRSGSATALAATGYVHQPSRGRRWAPGSVRQG